jgi:hypothetical protein
MSAMVRKMNGKYGISSSGLSKSVFWFSVPLKPISIYVSNTDINNTTGTTPTPTPTLLTVTVHSANESNTTPVSIKSSTNKLKDLIVRDPFHEVVNEMGCTSLASYKPKARTTERYEV